MHARICIFILENHSSLDFDILLKLIISLSLITIMIMIISLVVSSSFLSSFSGFKFVACGNDDHTKEVTKTMMMMLMTTMTKTTTK